MASCRHSCVLLAGHGLVLDGDLLAQFLTLPRKLQVDIAEHAQQAATSQAMNIDDSLHAVAGYMRLLQLVLQPV